MVIQDDGLPKPRPPRQAGRRPGDAADACRAATDAPVNVPQARAPRDTPPGATAGPDARPLGMVVSWIVWRGPAERAFAPRYAQPKDGKSQTQATFNAPGDYVLRATADDGAAATHAQTTIKVSGGTATTGPR